MLKESNYRDMIRTRNAHKVNKRFATSDFEQPNNFLKFSLLKVGQGKPTYELINEKLTMPIHGGITKWHRPQKQGLMPVFRTTA